MLNLVHCTLRYQVVGRNLAMRSCKDVAAQLVLEMMDQPLTSHVDL